jgi:MtrB/PioB family decaheme-associated outer membrane protein
MHSNSTFKLTLLATAIMGLQSQAATAQDADAAIQQLTKPESAISLGFDNLSDDRRQLGKYDGLNEEGIYFGLDADIRIRDDATGTWTTLSARNLGRDTREATVGYEQQGNWGVSVGFDQTPSRNPNTYFTGVRGIGTGTLQYGAIGTTAATAQTGLFPATTEVHLGTRRDAALLNVYKYLSPDLSLNINFKDEHKDGTRHWGRGVNPEFAVEPIDSDTRQLDVVLNHAGEKFQLSGGYSGSWYQNNNSFVDTIGGSQLNAPASTTNAAGHTFLSLPLDNQAHQAFVNGGYSFTKSTRATFKASYTVATQNDSLRPITNALANSGAGGTSTYIPFVPGAPSSLEGKVATTLLELGVTSKPIDKLSLVANARYQRRDDQTPQQVMGRYWTYRCNNTGATNQYSGTLPTVANCLALGGTTISNISGPNEIENNPRDFKNLAGKLEATYRLAAGYSVTGGLNYDSRERSFEIDPSGEYTGVVKMRGRTDETTVNLQVRRALTPTANGSVTYAHSERNGSSWHAAEGIAEANLPINFVNPAPYADRSRDKVKLVADWSPLDNAQFQFNYEFAKDKYEAGRAGVKDGESQLASVDANYAFSESWSVSAWASYDVAKHHQTGYTFDTGNPAWNCSSTLTAPACTTDLTWDAHLKDTGKSVGLGFRGKPVSKVSVGADVQWTQTKSEYPIDSNVPTFDNGTTVRSKQGLPDIKSTTTRLALFTQYAVEKNADVRLDVVRTLWKSDDWTWMEWNSAGTQLVPFTYMDGTRVIPDQNSQATFVGVRYTYRFQ